MKGALQEFEINVKIKLSALRASVMFCYIDTPFYILYGVVEIVLTSRCLFRVALAARD